MFKIIHFYKIGLTPINYKLQNEIMSLDYLKVVRWLGVLHLGVRVQNTNRGTLAHQVRRDAALRYVQVHALYRKKITNVLRGIFCASG
jgi:hypothetical protein